jgi:hypothetical protein
VKRDELAGGMGLFVEEHGVQDKIARAYVRVRWRTQWQHIHTCYTHVQNPTTFS